METFTQQTDISTIKYQSIKSRPDASFKILLFLMITFLVYGSLYLMIGWTQQGLKPVIFGNNPTNQGYMVYLLLTQVLGFIPGTFLVKTLIRKMNIRWIFVGSFAICFVALLLISLLDKISEANGIDLSVSAIVLFSIFSFIFGAAIAPILPLVTTYIGAAYTGKRQAKILGIGTGLYGIGAGIVPLVASSAIYDLTSQDFSSVRFFYYIAAGLALLAGFSGYFVDYRHSAQKTSSKIIDKKEYSFSIFKPAAIVITMMCMYMATETVGNFMFSNIANAEVYYKPGYNARKIAVDTQQAFGLFAVIQGVWRAISGLWILPKTHKPKFIVLSAAVLLTGFILIFTGELAHTWGKYVIAICFGIGYGATWTAIYLFANHIDQRRSSFIGMMVNLISMFFIPITQLLQALLWNAASPSTSSDALFYSPIIFATVTLSILAILAVFSSFYFRYFRKKHGLDSQGILKTK